VLKAIQERQLVGQDRAQGKALGVAQTKEREIQRFFVVNKELGYYSINKTVAVSLHYF